MPTQKLLVLGPTYKAKFQQVMTSPVASALFDIQFGSKLNNVGLVDVWKIFFANKVKTFDVYVFHYYENGRDGLEKVFDLKGKEAESFDEFLHEL